MENWPVRLLKLFYPPECLICGGIRALRPPLDACSGCLAELAARRPACERCGEDLANAPGTAVHCGTCLACPPPFARTHCLGRYEGALAVLVRGLKFQKRLENGRLLGQLMGRYLAARQHPAGTVLVPVPMHPARLRRRGFNQAAEIARWAGHEAGLPVRYDAVSRRRNTPAQTGLGASERRANLRKAFHCMPGFRAPRALIVDDVMTTGSTAAALATALLRHGWGHVEVWCCARASL